MTKTEFALFRAELFERAAKMLIGEPVEAPASAGKAAADAAAPPAPEERHDATDEGRTDAC